jgi:hypothetical protein
MSESPTSRRAGDEDPERLPAGLPAGASAADVTSLPPPPSAKHDPRWASRSASRLMETSGARVVEAQQTIAELRKTQASVAKSLGETRDAVLWLQKLEVLEQQLVLVPEYRERAKKIVAEMAAVSQRLAKAKKRASALSGEEFPDYEEDAEAK